MRFPLLAAALVSALAVRLTAAPSDPANFTETTYIQNASLALPTCIGWAPDGSGRLFVTRKTGEVMIVQHNAAANTGTVVATPWATINPVFTNSECGLIGMCFDPDFVNNRYVYFFATVSGDLGTFTGEQQIIRYTDNPGTNTGSNKTVIVAGLPTRAVNHDGGALGIGPDGRLYWAIGDNANNTGVDGDLTSLCAKVGRANRFTGAALNDNPFYDGAGANNDYIWARGFRNPFSMTFQPGSGELWLSVVGSSPAGDTIPRSGPGFEQVFVVPRGAHGGWNDYENNQPSGYLPPVIAYGTNTTVSVNLTAAGAVRMGGVDTFTTQSVHPFRAGARVTIAGAGDPSFNGGFYVAARVSDTQFTVVQNGADAASGGGTATTVAIGGCTVGGSFYNSTAFPAAYRGNFFFGDTNTGNFLRAALDVNNVPVSVDFFVTGASPIVDSATGPDGALYVAQVDGNGRIRRIGTTSTAQNLIVQPTALPVQEGGSAVFTVRLAAAPAANVTVIVSKTGGDADLNVASGSALTFTPANWNQFQSVTISAAEDADLDHGSASFDVNAAGIATYTVTASEIDNDEPRLVLSQNNVSFSEGGTGAFTVALASAPASNVTVTVARASGDSDITVASGATLLFTPGNYATAQAVTLAAAEDADNAADSAVIAVTLAGEPVRNVLVSVSDNDPAAPVFTSTPKTAATLNVPYSYDADASGNPAPGYSFSGTPPTGMTINGTTGVITWTPASTGTFAVTVRANNGSGFTTQSFNIVVSADAAPLASLTRPMDGDVMFGTNAEFYGDGFDDAGCVKAEFLVDGVVTYTDINSAGHYHHGGTHAMFNTTLFANGPHTLRFRVTDTAGQTGFVDVPITIGNGAAAWKGEKFTAAEQANAAISGDLADPDADGVMNLFEYLADSAPKSASIARAPQLLTVNVGGADYLAIQFITARWAGDVSASVEAAPSPGGPWTSIDPDDPTLRVSLATNTPAPGLDTRVVRDSQPLGSGQRYLRLRATR